MRVSCCAVRGPHLRHSVSRAQNDAGERPRRLPDADCDGGETELLPGGPVGEGTALRGLLE